MFMYKRFLYFDQGGIWHTSGRYDDLSIYIYLYISLYICLYISKYIYLYIFI